MGKNSAVLPRAGIRVGCCEKIRARDTVRGTICSGGLRGRHALVRIAVGPAARALKSVRLRRSTLSDTSHLNWREAYALAREEKDPARIPEICARARRLIQKRQPELATFSHMHDEEITDLEGALRHLWIMEDKNR
jgi:hypothetical protein